MTETIHRIGALELGESLSFDGGYTCGLKWNLRRLENSYLAEDSERDRETCNLARGETVYCSFFQ
jgi:hypothetical protein